VINIENIKKEIVQRLKPINANKIILFGSYAYGTPNKDSDLDLCIIKDKINSKIKEKREIRKLLNNIDMPMDILTLENNYYLSHSDKNWINTPLYDIRTKGDILYEKK